MSYQRYEAAKRYWQRNNPGATPGECEAAIRAIADRLGL